MADLIVVGFKKDMDRASKVLSMLRPAVVQVLADLSDAVAVYRDYKGKLRVDQSDQTTTGENAAWGGVFGGLFGGLLGALIAAPFGGAADPAAMLAVGSLSGVALGVTFGAIDAETCKEDHGISDDFVDRVSSMVQPGDSAVFIFARTVNPDLVATAFRGYGGEVIRTTLTDSQRARVEATLHGAR
jgi:uncharacterized membrane protein